MDKVRVLQDQRTKPITKHKSKVNGLGLGFFKIKVQTKYKTQKQNQWFRVRVLQDCRTNPEQDIQAKSNPEENRRTTTN